MIRTLILVAFLLLGVENLPAQRLSVDSLERNGYRVRVYKPQPSRTRIVLRTIHDTIPVTRVVFVLIRDTLVRERVTLRDRRIERVSIMPSPETQSLRYMLIGNANTNGYGMHVGGELTLGTHIAFFIGCGMGYNSVTKLTHLGLAGLLMIRL